jgi:hypothetical protein
VVAVPSHTPTQAPTYRAGGGFVPEMDAMIDAQKFCKQAVSALQFYDHENAKKQIYLALALLERPAAK